MPRILVILSLLVQDGLCLHICGSKNITKQELCTFDEGYGSIESQPLLKIHTSLTLFSMSDFNSDTRIMSVNIHLSMFWNDTRVTLESNQKLK